MNSTIVETSMLTALQRAIVEYLNTHAGPHTALDIQFELLGERADYTGRQIRRAIRDLNGKGYPIVSTRRGFHLAKTWHAIGAYRDQLVRRASGIMERVRALDSVMANGYSTPVQNPEGLRVARVN